MDQIGPPKENSFYVYTYKDRKTLSSNKYTPTKLNSSKSQTPSSAGLFCKRTSSNATGKKLPHIKSNLFDRYKSTPLLSKDEFIQKYLIKKRKKTMIISKYLDEDLRKRLESLKYKSFKPTQIETIEHDASNDQNEDYYYDDYYDSNDNNNYIEPSSITINTSISSFSDSLNHFPSSKKTRNNYSNVDMNKSKTLSFKTSRDKQDILNTNQKEIPRDVRFGSTLSRDGQFALLKSLEDEIIQEIHAVYPELSCNQIPRISTANYKKMMHHSRNRNLLNERRVNENLNELTELEKKRIVTKSIESAMEILDLLRMKKKLLEQNSVNIEENELFSSALKQDPDLDREYVELRNFKIKQASFVTSFHATTMTNTLSNALSDPFKKYSEWCSEWSSQLDSI